VLFIATVEGDQGIHFVRLAPVAFRLHVNTRPRPPLGAHLAIALPGLVAPTRDALESWAQRHAPMLELPRASYRPVAVGDLMEAFNWEAHLQLARAASADELAAFAQGRGGALLAELRAALANTEPAADRLAARAARFAAIAGVATAAESLAELAALHPVEHLMGLEHAVAQWIRATTDPPADELAALAKDLPDDRVSAGASRAWFAWWWRLAYRTQRAELRAVAEAAALLARRECGRADIARAACDEAERMLDHLRVATGARLWAEPPDGTFAPVRDNGDAHYCAYMVVTHAAHAIAAAFRVDHDAGDANRHAMELVATCALDVLLDGQ
jgi:hypothetical protein